MEPGDRSPDYAVIAYCHLLNDRSGSPRVLKEAIQAMGSSGILFLGSQGSGVLDEVDIPVRRYWYRRSRYRLVTLFTFLLSQIALYRELSRASLPPNAIVYVNTLMPFGAAIWAFVHKRRVVYHVHEVSLSPRLLRDFLVMIARKTADLLIFVSKDNLARLPVGDATTVVIPNSVPRGFGASATTHIKSVAGQQSLFRILMLASARDYKGIPELIELANRLQDRPNVQFQLVLNADDEEIERYLAQFDVPDTMVVFPRSSEPVSFYREADLVLNLSRVDLWIETFGLTLVEAMTFAVPVIAPPIGGPAEIVTDGKEGFLVDSRDMDEVEKKVRLLIDDTDLRARLSQQAQRRAMDFTFEAFSANLHQALALLETDRA